MTRACRSGHDHADAIDVMLCQQDHIIDLLRGLTLMTEATGETIDQGFDELEAGEADIEAKLDALTVEEEKELAFLADLENNRGTGQLAPDQQARLDDLKARQAKASAALDEAREELAQADGTEPAPAPESVPAPTEPPASEAPASGTDAPVGEPAASDTPIADGIGEPAPVDTATGDGNATGAAPVVADEEPAPNEI